MTYYYKRRENILYKHMCKDYKAQQQQQQQQRYNRSRIVGMDGIAIM